jgi:hypothetical protein
MGKQRNIHPENDVEFQIKNGLLQPTYLSGCLNLSKHNARQLGSMAGVRQVESSTRNGMRRFLITEPERHRDHLGHQHRRHRDDHHHQRDHHRRRPV